MTRTLAVALTLMTAAIVGCSNDPVSSDDSPLAGLTQAEASDSIGNPSTPQPGGIRGTVVGPATASAGSDSVDHYPRLSGVTVTVYPFAGSNSISTDDDREFSVGAAIATATTDAEGRFTFPDLPAAHYILTFRPPAASAYRGVWVSVPTSASTSYGWWVALPRNE